MDGRAYDGIEKVAVSQFDKPQRQRLEAFTAAKALLHNRTTEEMLKVAQYISTGAVYR